MKTFQERLCDLREDSDTKQVELAHLLGVSQQQYSRYENGKSNVSVSGLYALAEHFNVSVDYLIGRTDSKQTPGVLTEVIADDWTMGMLVQEVLSLSKTGRKAVIEYVEMRKLKEKASKK